MSWPSPPLWARCCRGCSSSPRAPARSLAFWRCAPTTPPPDDTAATPSSTHLLPSAFQAPPRHHRCRRGAWCDRIGRHSACGTTSISAEPDSRPPLPHCGDGRGPARTTPGRRADACAIDMPLTRGATRTAAAATPTSRRADRVVAGSQPHVDTLQTKEVAPLVVRLGQSS